MASFTRNGRAVIVDFDVDLSDYTPKNVKAKSHGKKVYLSWDKPIVNGILHPDIRKYRIYHSMDGSDFTVMAELPAAFPRTWSWFPDLDVGKHYFKVTTVFKNEYESPASDVATVVHGEGYGD